MSKPVIVEVRRACQRLIMRWYKGFCCNGNRKKIEKLIISIIHQHALSKFLPLMYIKEKLPEKNEFYLFFAIESKKFNDVPKEVEDNLLLKLRQKRRFKIKAIKTFSYYEEIRAFIGTELDIYEFTYRIAYQPVQKTSYDNPFDWINPSSVNHSSPDIKVVSEQYEQFLYWLSAIGTGTWESFKKSCIVMNLEEPKRILRRLKLLGHIESSADGSRWSIAPTAFVKVSSESNTQKFILCGQRNLYLINELKKYAQVDVRNQPKGDAPPCICVIANNYEQISELMKQINTGTQLAIANVDEVSLQLAGILPELASWKHNLRSLPGIVPSLYEWQYFDCNVNDFVSCISPIKTGMYRMESQKTGYKYTIFYDKESDRWLQGDWYGLRFLALQHNQQECIASYDRATNRLAIPVSQRLPEIYERALVLASGLLPVYQGSWLLYENVELDLAHLLSDKLKIKCLEASTHA